MNCPCHVQIFRQGIRSYRELPLRLAEFGSCHRYEPSGALHGIMRVRAFTQDDAHIFCTEEQIAAGDRAVRRAAVARSTAISASRSSASSSPTARRCASARDEVWDQAEAALREACAIAGVEYDAEPRRGRVLRPEAGIRAARRDRPRLAVRHAAGRFHAAGAAGRRICRRGRRRAHRPVMLHRAILGSFERFLGILIEHYAGRFPLWLAPVQAVVATIVSDADDYAARGGAALRAAGLAVGTDLPNQKINAKVREHSLAHVPVLAVVGRQGGGEPAPWRCAGWAAQAQEVLPLDEAVRRLAARGDATRSEAMSGPRRLDCGGRLELRRRTASNSACLIATDSDRPDYGRLTSTDDRRRP